MKTLIKVYGKKFLSLVMALLMTLTIVNLAPFAQEAKAATTLYFHADDWSSAYLWSWGGYSTSTWPGDALTKVEGTNGWWSLNINADSFTGYIQETGGGRGCDRNFSVSGGGEKYVVFKNDTSTAYGSLAEAEAAAGELLSGTPEETTEAAKPDVIVTDISWSPASPKAGDAVTFTATIKNQGTVATPAGKTGVAFTVNGGSKTWNGDYTTSIPAGGTITLTANNGDNGTSWTASEGTFSVVATIDSTGYTESDTSNNSFTKNITVAAAAPTTFDFTFKDGTSDGWLDDAGATFQVVANGTTYNMGGGSGTWTATIPLNATSITVNRKAPDGGTWNSWTIDTTSRGTETVYTATGSGVGQWGTPATEPTTAAPTTFVFTFKDGTDSGWLDDANALFRIVADGTTYNVSGGSGTWTATLPANVSSITVNRLNPDYPDTAPWNSWTIDATNRGTETVYTATGSGTGQWGSSSTEQPTQPSYTGDIYGTPFTELQSWDMSQLELEPVVDVNTGSGRVEELYVVPATFYNYKSGGGSAWWNQFNSLNAAIVDRYYGTGKMEYPLLIGAPDSMRKEGDAEGSRSLFNMMNGKTNPDITNELALFYINHNLTGDGYGSTNNYGSVSSPVQGLVAEYMDSNTGSLLSAENNVLMPYFDDNFLGTTGDGNVIEGTWATKYGSQWARLSFPFRKVGNYYVFDSGSGTDNIRIENGKVVYDSSAPVRNGYADYPGFYPFDTTADAGNHEALTYGFGARLDIPFNVVNKTDDEQDSTNMLMSGSAAFGDGGPRWNELTLDQTLQPGTYQLRIVHDGGGFAFTQYKAGGADSGQHAHGFDNHKDTTVASYQSFGDIDGGREALINLKAPIVQTIEVTEATNKISFYGKLWGTQNFSVELYANGATIVPPSGVDNDIVFNFSGDDDLWIYVDGKLALDIGGSHGQASGSINFTDGTITVNDRFVMNYNGGDDGKGWPYGDNRSNATTDASWLKFDDPNETHVMTVFYMERGLYDSNLSISYNFIPVDLTQKNGLTVNNKVDLSEVNAGFNLKENDFSFNYDVYDVTANNNNLLFPNGEITITGNGGKNASLEQDGADDNTIRGDEIKVTQEPNNNFNTSYTLTDTNNHEISSSTGKSDSYNVTDGKNDAGSTSDNTFVLDNLSNSCGCDNSEDSSLLVTVDFVNKAKVTSIVIGKNDSSVAYDDNNTYTFTVTYSRLLGVERNGFFDGTYVVTDTRDGSKKTASTTNGEITIHAYETAEITGVPVDSNIKISEKDTGNYIKTVVTDSTGTETTIANDGSYSLSEDETVSYSWTIYNGDGSAVEYFAEVGTQIVINAGDEITLIANGSASGTTYYDKYIPQVGGMTVTNAPATDAVTGGCDLVVTDVSWISDGVLGGPINVGSVVSWNVTVKNIGDTDVPAGDKIGFNLNGQIWNGDYTYGLKAGESAVITTNSGYDPYGDGTFVATDSTTSYTVTVDDKNLHAETNESNNTYAFSMTTPYAPATTEQVRIDATYTYHETISKVSKVASTIGTVTLTDGNTITYLYPANSAAGVDSFYYEISKIADSDVVADGQVVVRAGQVISTTTVPAKVYAYAGNDDVYVIDYGLPVSLTSAPNNMRANDITTLAGVATDLVEFGFVGSGSALSSAVAATGLYKAAEIGYVVAGNAVYGGVASTGTDAAGLNNYNYKLNKFMDGIDTFSYGFQVVKEGTDVSTAKLNASNATPVINSKVTVIPASVVYYEDNFSYDSTTGTTTAITYTGNGIVYNSTGLDITQSNSLDELYGFDEAYANMIGDGNGSTVLEKSQKVSFTFKGTGFDIVARTADTATVLYVVSKGNQVVTMGNVDTYYDAGVLYQLPVISVKDLDYNEYTVQFMILTSSAYSQFYFDGIRIYNPLNVTEDGYLDRTGWTATASHNNGAAAKVFDGDVTNAGRWTTVATQVPDMWFTVDMGKVSTFDTLELLLGGSNDAPAGYAIYVSNDGSNWGDAVATGAPAQTNEQYYLGVQTARYIKIVQTGTRGLYWSINELQIKNSTVADYYKGNELGATVTPIIDMILGDCTFTETGIYDAEGNLISETIGTPAGSQIAVVGDMVSENLGSGNTKTGSSLVEILEDGPNEEVYLGDGSKLVFYATKNNEVTNDADRTLQVEVKAVSGDTVLEDVRVDNKSSWVATSSSGVDGKFAIDDDLSTRWHGSYQRSETERKWFQVDMAKEYTFDAINLALGSSSNDWPANYEVFISDNGTDWNSVKSGVGEAGLETIYLGPTTTRYIRIEQWGVRYSNYWSIHEFSLKSAVRNTDPSSKTNWSVIDTNYDEIFAYRLLDGALIDRWTSYNNMGSATEDSPVYFVVDLGSRYDFDTVQMLLGSYSSDQPDNYKISVSNDNATWTVVSSRTDGSNPNGTEEYSVGAQNARYIKVEGWGSTIGGTDWSVVEFGIANKSGKNIGLNLSLNSTKDVIASINTNTAMYYEIPMNLCTEESTGKYLVVINGASSDDYNLSFTNLKVKGYDITPYTTTDAAIDAVNITEVTVNGSKNITVNKKAEVAFKITLSEDADVNQENLALTANGKSVSIRSVKPVAGTSNQYIVKTLAPNAVGIFTYEFAYTNSDGTKAVTSVSTKVTASRSR